MNLIVAKQNSPRNQLAESDFGKQASLTAAAVARQAQEGARTANDGLMRFVDAEPAQGRYRAAPLDESKRDFWDDFAAIGESKVGGGGGAGSSAIGTAAMGKGRKKEDEWDW